MTDNSCLDFRVPEARSERDGSNARVGRAVSMASIGEVVTTQVPRHRVFIRRWLSILESPGIAMSNRTIWRCSTRKPRTSGSSSRRPGPTGLLGARERLDSCHSGKLIPHDWPGHSPALEDFLNDNSVLADTSRGREAVAPPLLSRLRRKDPWGLQRAGDEVSGRSSFRRVLPRGAFFHRGPD